MYRMRIWKGAAENAAHNYGEHVQLGKESNRGNMDLFVEDKALRGLPRRRSYYRAGACRDQCLDLEINCNNHVIIILESTHPIFLFINPRNLYTSHYSNRQSVQPETKPR